MEINKLHQLDFDSLVNNIENSNYGIARIEWEADNSRRAKSVQVCGAKFIPSDSTPMRGGYTVEDAIEDALRPEEIKEVKPAVEHLKEFAKASNQRGILIEGESQPQFQVGDVVKFKSGGPAMTVTVPSFIGWIECQWFDGSVVHTERFLKDTLKPWTAYDDPTVPKFYDPEAVQVVK